MSLFRKTSKKTFESELKQLTSGTNILEFKGELLNYNITIASGGFGKVYKASYKSLNIAVKKIMKYNAKQLVREIQISKRFGHPNIPRLLGIVRHSESQNDYKNRKTAKSLFKYTNPFESLERSFDSEKKPSTSIENDNQLFISKSTSQNCSSFLEITDTNDLNNKSDVECLKHDNDVDHLKHDYPFDKSQSNPIKKERGNSFYELSSNKKSMFLPQRPDFDIVFEFIKGMTLLDLIHSFEEISELEKILMLLNFTHILEYFHSNNIIHRDLKPANILVNEYRELILLDFGISKQRSKETTQTIRIGTINYMAPENFNMDEQKKNTAGEFINDEDETDENAILVTQSCISTKVDIWGFGCIAHELFTKIKPWTNKFKASQKIISCLYSKKKFPIDKSIYSKPYLKKLLEKCFEINPAHRIDIKQARFILLEYLFDKVSKGIRDNTFHQNNELNIKSHSIYEKCRIYLEEYYKLRQKNFRTSIGLMK